MMRETGEERERENVGQVKIKGEQNQATDQKLKKRRQRHERFAKKKEKVVLFA
jgi:hypothetical protein